MGLAVTYPVNIIATVTRRKKVGPPGNSYLESTNAAMDAIIRCPTVPTAVMSTVLNRYLEKVTQDFPMVTNRSEKLSVVGFFGSMVGGNRNNSSSGFSALPTE